MGILQMGTKPKRELHAIDITRDLVEWIEAVESGDALVAGFLSADADGWALMADGYLAANATARAKMAASFFGAGIPASLAQFETAFWAATDTARAKWAASFFAAGNAPSAAIFQDGFWANAVVAKFADALFAADAASRAKFADGIWPAVKMAYQPAMDIGANPVNGLRLIADLNNGDIITIDDGVTPEEWTARLVPALPYEFVCGGGAPATLANFVAEVNLGAGMGTPSALAHALDIKGDCVGLVGITGVALTLAENTVGARCAVFNANFQGLRAAADRAYAGREHAITVNEAGAIDPAIGNGEICVGNIPSTVLPELISWGVRDATLDAIDATGLRFRIAQVNALQYSVFVSQTVGGPPILATGDIISFLCSVAG